jgi:hypothetical protein
MVKCGWQCDMTTAMIQFLMQMEQMLDLIDQILDALEANCLEAEREEVSHDL